MQEQSLQLEKTNEEMYEEALMYFDETEMAHKEQLIEKLTKIFNLDNRTVVDLRNLQDYLFCKTLQESRLQKKLDCLYDILAWLIDEVISEKDPVAYKQIMDKYTLEFSVI